MAEYAIIFHGDADGIASAALVALWLEKHGKSYELYSPRSVELFPVNEPKVIVLDIGKPFRFNKPVIWIDHHAVIAEDLLDMPEFYLNPRKFGKNLPTAYVTWRIFGGPAWLAYLGSISDTFNIPKRIEYPKSLIRGLVPIVNSSRAFNLQVEAVKALMKGPQAIVGKKFLEAWRKAEEEARKAAEKARVFGRLAIAEFSSELYISNYVASKLRRHGIGVAANFVDGKVEVEMRALPWINVNLAEIAAKYGGGGHAKAAGVTLSEKDWEKLKEEIVKIGKEDQKTSS